MVGTDKVTGRYYDQFTDRSSWNLADDVASFIGRTANERVTARIALLGLANGEIPGLLDDVTAIQRAKLAALVVRGAVALGLEVSGEVK